MVCHFDEGKELCVLAPDGYRDYEIFMGENLLERIFSIRIL